MHARITRFAGLPPERIDVTLEQFEQQELPNIEAADGYKGITVMVDRGGGAVVAVSYWESMEAMRASGEAAKRAREQALETAQPQPRRDPIVDHYEVLLDRQA